MHINVGTHTAKHILICRHAQRKTHTHIHSYIQLAYEQHKFEMHKSTYTWDFLNKYMGFVIGYAASDSTGG